MLNYVRNKLISVARENEDTLSVYGVLDDDLYEIGRASCRERV